jgi:hypothetical protein
VALRSATVRTTKNYDDEHTEAARDEVAKDFSFSVSRNAFSMGLYLGTIMDHGEKLARESLQKNPAKFITLMNACSNMSNANIAIEKRKWQSPPTRIADFQSASLRTTQRLPKLRFSPPSSALEKITSPNFAPSFSSTFYEGPFTLSQSATVRAIGYSADFLQMEEADTVNAVVLVRHTLSVSASGGGYVNTPSGSYLSTNVISATAVPLPGWSFLYWLGDAAGTNPTINISMERDKTIYGVFGTTLSTTVAGNGQIQVFPSTGVYPYGSVVRLTAVPQPGDYFGFWGNAASGNINPLYFSVTSPAPTVSSIFGATPAGQAALTVIIAGDGSVSASPRANSYAVGQSVTLTATANSDQSFLSWSGDASGSQNPIAVSMNKSEVITANFSARPLLSTSRSGLEGTTAEGFRMTLISDPQTVWQILESTNLVQWEVLGEVTNTQGEVQITDPGALRPPSRFYRAAPWP